jgi:zinc protease
MNALISLTLALALAATPSAPTPTVPPEQREQPPKPGKPADVKIPERRELTLPNGLQVTLAPYGNMPKVDVQLVVSTGNVHEGPEQTWLADLTGQMLPEGTTTRSAEQLAQEAAKMGGSLEQNVTPDETSIGGTVLSEFAPQLIALVADVVKSPAFPAQDFERVRADALRNLSIMRSQPQMLSQERILAATFPGHAYGRMFPSEAQLKGYTVQQVRDFHEANFGAKRSHLYVVGRFDEAAVEAAVRQAFGDWKEGPGLTRNVPKPTMKRAVHLIDRPGSVQSALRVGLPVVDPSHPDYIKLLVTNTLLGGSFGSRITRNIREAKGYTYSPSSQLSAYYRTNFWSEIADVTTNVTGPSLKEIFGEVNRLQAEPPSQAELDAIKNYVVGTFVLQNSQRGGILGRLRFMDLHELPDSYLEDYVKNVMAVTPEDVQQMAKKYLKDENMVVVITGDKKAIEKQVKPFGPLVVNPPK